MFRKRIVHIVRYIDSRQTEIIFFSNLFWSDPALRSMAFMLNYCWLEDDNKPETELY